MATLATVTLAMLVARFVTLARQVQALRFSLGDVVLKMREVESDRRVILAALKEALPDAKAMLGYEITQRTLDNLATMASTFAAEGGLSSGPHMVTRSDIETLGLTPEQGAQLASAMASGAVRVKRVSDVARKMQRKNVTPEQSKALRERVVAMLEKGTDQAPTVKSLAQLVEEKAALEKRIEKLQAERARLVSQIAAHQAPKAPALAAPPMLVRKPKDLPAPQPKRDRAKSRPSLAA
jgi:hypothetical protein